MLTAKFSRLYKGHCECYICVRLFVTCIQELAVIIIKETHYFDRVITDGFVFGICYMKMSLFIG